MKALQFVRLTLKTIFKYPAMYGSPEAVEAQVLTLLEVRFVLTKGFDPQRTIVDAYSAFGRAERPEVGNKPLSTLYPNVKDLAPLLEKFAKSW